MMGPCIDRYADMAILTAERHKQIAAAVRSVEFIVGKGTCWWRTLTGKLALQAVGIKSQVRIGGMVYRCGPDEIRDVVAFCSSGNRGTRAASGYLLAHTWLETEHDDLVDFSVGDWQAQNEACENLPEDMLNGVPIGAARWTAPKLPEFFWQPKRDFGWQPRDTPPLGVAWYGPYSGEKPSVSEAERDLAPYIDTAMPIILNSLQRAGLLIYKGQKENQ